MRDRYIAQLRMPIGGSQDPSESKPDFRNSRVQEQLKSFETRVQACVTALGR